MTIPTVDIFLFLVAAIIGTSFILFVWIPRDLRSMFRYQLWQLRDEIVDAGLSGKLDLDATVIRSFVHRVESAISNSDQISFVWRLMQPKHTKEVLRETRTRLARGLKQLPKEQRRLMMGYNCRFNRAIASHAICGSTSGFMFLCIVLAVLLGYGIVHCVIKYGFKNLINRVKYGFKNPINRARFLMRKIRRFASAPLEFDDVIAPVIPAAPQLAACV